MRSTRCQGSSGSDNWGSFAYVWAKEHGFSIVPTSDPRSEPTPAAAPVTNPSGTDLEAVRMQLWGATGVEEPNRSNYPARAPSCSGSGDDGGSDRCRCRAGERGDCPGSDAPQRTGAGAEGTESRASRLPRRPLGVFALWHGGGGRPEPDRQRPSGCARRTGSRDLRDPEGPRSEHHSYEHRFAASSRPRLCYGSSDGRLFVVGGSYLVKPSGIVG